MALDGVDAAVSVCLSNVKQPRSQSAHFVIVKRKRSGISIAKMEMDTRSDLLPPLPPLHPVFAPLSLAASGPADVTVPFSLLVPSPYSLPGSNTITSLHRDGL